MCCKARSQASPSEAPASKRETVQVAVLFEVDDRNHKNPYGPLAIRKGSQISDNELFDLILRLGHLVHVGRFAS